MGDFAGRENLKDMPGFATANPDLYTPIIPASSTSPGTHGQWTTDSTGYYYYCIAQNTWRRVLGSAWGDYSFIPDQLAHWVAQDLDAVGNGSNITTWADKSGNGHTLTPVGTNSTLLTNALNGQDVVNTATATSGYATSSAFSFSSSAPYCFVFVFNILTGQPSEGGFFGVSDGTSTGFRCGPSSTTGQWEYTVPGVGNYFLPVGSISVATWHYMFFQFDPTATPKHTVYVDSTTTNTAWTSAPGQSQTSANDTTFHLLASGYSGCANKCAEAWVFGRVLTTDERNLLQSYIQTNYGLA